MAAGHVSDMLEQVRMCLSGGESLSLGSPTGCGTWRDPVQDGSYAVL